MLATCIIVRLYMISERNQCIPSSPCQHSGVCVDMMGETPYFCNCTEEYSGVDCEIGMLVIFRYIFLEIKASRCYFIIFQILIINYTASKALCKINVKLNKMITLTHTVKVLLYISCIPGWVFCRFHQC